MFSLHRSGCGGNQRFTENYCFSQKYIICQFDCKEDVKSMTRNWHLWIFANTVLFPGHWWTCMSLWKISDGRWSLTFKAMGCSIYMSYMYIKVLVYSYVYEHVPAWLYVYLTVSCVVSELWVIKVAHHIKFIATKICLLFRAKITDYFFSFRSIDTCVMKCHYLCTVMISSHLT